MASSSKQQPVFLNRPQAEAYDIPWREHVEPSNPTLRGLALKCGATLITYLPFLQRYFWSNAGFAILRDRPELDDVDPRYDPQVIKTWGVPATVPTPDSEIALKAMLSEDWESRRPPRQDYWTILDFHEAYKSRRITPTDVVNALLPLARRDATERSKHSTAFLQAREDLALAAAEASTSRYRKGTPLSPLDGVPIAIKDELDVAGYHKTFGSRLEFTREDNATTYCVDLWLRAGAVLIGKTNMHELGSDPLTNNPIHGTPLNPHNDNYYCGGSSGGSAYALAAGLVPLAEGNDGGGSIRIPAAYCGVYGLKTSCGRLSIRPSGDIAKSTAVAGPMAANMLDLEIGFRIMAHPDPDNLRTALWTPPVPATSVPNRKTLGIFAPWFERAAPAVQARCRTLLAHLTAHAGYTVHPITLPLLRPEAQTAHALTILSEMLTAISPSSPHFRALSPPNWLLLSVAQQTSSQDFLQAQRLRHLLMRHLAHLFDTLPGLVIVTPTTPEAGWRIRPGDLGPHGLSDPNSTLRSMEYVHLANFSGCPAISVPAGFVPDAAAAAAAGAAKEGGNGGATAERVPVGLMGMGEWGADEELIAFGYDCERALAAILAKEGVGRRPTKSGNWVDAMALAGRV